MKNNFGIVYSTGHGKMCPSCGKASGSCICRQKCQPPPGNGLVRVGRETKGRKGKGVTVITGIPLSGEDLKTLAKKLKQKCGSGGTIKNGILEIQGDHRDEIVKVLKLQGFQVKRSGG